MKIGSYALGGSVIVGAFALASNLLVSEPESCRLNADGIVELTLSNGKVVANDHWRMNKDNTTCYSNTSPPVLVPAR